MLCAKAARRRGHLNISMLANCLGVAGLAEKACSVIVAASRAKSSKHSRGARTARELNLWFDRPRDIYALPAGRVACPVDRSDGEEIMTADATLSRLLASLDLFSNLEEL